MCSRKYIENTWMGYHAFPRKVKCQETSTKRVTNLKTGKSKELCDKHARNKVRGLRQRMRNTIGHSGYKIEDLNSGEIIIGVVDGHGLGCDIIETNKK